MRSRAFRRKMKRKKNKRRFEIIEEYGYNPSVGYVDHEYIDGTWKATGKYIKYPKDSKTQKFYKNYSNRLLRRTTKPVQQKGNGYRKNFDYKWNID